MKTHQPLNAIAMALGLALALGSPGMLPAQTATHDGHDAAALEIVLNNGAKWKGDQNMITGMGAIRDTMSTNLEAIHGGTISVDEAKGIAGDVQKQIDFMIENCVLEPAVDEQFHVVLAQVADGTSTLEAGEVAAGAGKIVNALNAYGDHFEHPDWQPLH